MEKPKACIFVVDDEKAYVESIEALFRCQGFEVIKATRAKRALELSDQIRPDIIITDIRMPQLDGIALIKKFKQALPQIKVIVMTGYYADYEDDIKRLRHAKLVDGHVRKPFYARELEACVNHVLGLRLKKRELKPKANLLLVDDETEVLDFMRSFFSDMGFAVFVAEKAVEALELYETVKPDVVLTDIKMPEHDGFWLIERLKEKNPNVRVVVMTGQDDQPMLERFKELGIKEYFSKPFGVEDLEQMSKKFSESVDEVKNEES